MPATCVCVSIVTYNSERYIRRCLDAVLKQRGVRVEAAVVDNASADRTREILERYRGRVRITLNGRNSGFAAAQNQIIRSGHAPWVLTLNPDVLMGPDFVASLVAAGESDPEAGSVCGRLLSIGPGFRPLPRRILDSTGLYFTPEMRHFDRGWHEPDGQRFDQMEYVFGVSAAAALYRRETIEDLSFEGDFFDPDFFSYREDADVAWRAQLLGWRCLYTPAAEAFHVRRAIPGDRRSVPPVINMHSVKNRFLMRIKNATPGLLRRYWGPMSARDLVVAGGCLFSEPRSLEAFWRLAAALPRALRWRRQIMRRRRAGDSDLAMWFNSRPISQPAGQRATAAGSAGVLARAAG